MTPQSAALRDYLADPVGAARERLEAARKAYGHASAAWIRQRTAGGIVEETDSRETVKGVKHKTVSPEAAAVMGYFQIAKAELDSAHAQLKYELERQAPEPDRRLPPEQEEDECPF